ncbi:MAG: hypothetical protein A3E37_02355 [Candidatus Andersenbacteria bacterium RIFCSPHIGHO2_12_FULL_46_9]|nr:MAG: hypothetical protein UW94_C0011G0045 [Parcubacteria group bacterium GW2011_GWA2_45_14]OGY34589.1 MAG: hypothetical protein A3B76_06390 [Candidatus Andersenbacteria bacterium RIFCSPHIGHO2_02_FULL_46_16]OGY36381.1 MAG: hypothetical protein A3E37_02355 [Candidatus Andersenbacteria bacterium RIFCSPHIGHO2_12_FULL_46_9]OGY37874.1 MAG: hypothetical protein A3I08_01645 [Candidatus Andersenbacteria bacterium RIFCSPLOWO2_02_FULL_46_11]OGY42671.1 MAG: hypothetical protein A3G57_03490 [Candidatus A
MQPTTVTLIGAGFERVYEVTKYKWMIDTGIELWLTNGRHISMRSGMYAIIIEQDLVEPK